MDAKAVMSAVCEVYDRWNEGPLNDVQALLQIEDALDQWTERMPSASEPVTQPSHKIDRQTRTPPGR